MLTISSPESVWASLKLHWYPLLLLIDIIDIILSLLALQFNFSISYRNTDFSPSHSLHHPGIDLNIHRLLILFNLFFMAKCFFFYSTQSRIIPWYMWVYYIYIHIISIYWYICIYFYIFNRSCIIFSDTLMCTLLTSILLSTHEPS